MKKFLFTVLTSIFIGFTTPLSSQDHQLFINEFMASNLTTTMDVDYYAFSDWIEVYNAESFSIDLGGYYISTEAKEFLKWRIPENTIIAAGDFLLFWADENNTKRQALHTNFTLQREGGNISLWYPNNTIVHSIDYTEQEVDVSWGQNPGNPLEWQFFGQPSPDKVNSISGFLSPDRASKPEFSIPGGVYEESLSVELSSSSPTATVYYTLDGSMPSRESMEYLAAINITATSVIRAFSYEVDLLPSRTESHSYLINEGINLPIISISMNPEFFWHDEIGFYVEGTNGLTGWEAGYGPSPKSNFNQNWRRPMHIEFFDEEHQFGFSTEGQVKVYGGWSRGAVIKSLAIYPEPSLNYRLFKEKPFLNYESFIIRNSGNDWPSSKIRDAALQSLAINQMDIDLQANRPAVLFINGEFWGVLNIREKINEDYVKTNHGFDQDSIDYIEAFRLVAKAGDKIHYNKMMSFLSSNSLSNDENYEYFKTLVDVEECLNYFITGIYAGHGDWIYNSNNNIRFWRPRTADGKWRWLLYDTDGVFQSSTSRGIADAMAYSTILTKLLENDQAKSYFVNTFSALLNGAFAPERALHMIDSLKLTIEPDVSRHITKWRNIDDLGNLAVWKTPGADGYIQIDDGYMGPSLDSYAQWESKFSQMRDVAQKRPPWLLSQLQTVFNLGEQKEIRFKVSGLDEGIIEVNSIPVLDYVGPDYYLSGQTLNLEAVPKYGYKFKHWEFLNYNTTTVGLIPKNSVWKYLDDGSNQGTAWIDPSFNDLSWKSGFAELGYGDGGESTILSYGSNSSSKYITSYFRKEFTVDNAALFESLNLNIQRDDGAVVYLNGTEIVRLNMPGGDINYTTQASVAISAGDESAFQYHSIPIDKLISGTNLIAVEIHQISPTSSDISFDLELSAIQVNSVEDSTITLKKFDHEVTGNAYLLAVFEAVDEVKSLYVNEIMTKNINFSWPHEEGDERDWIEIYNSGNRAVNIEGMYISDDLTNPKLYRIPSSDLNATSIPSKGFIVLYADGKPELGPTHLNFQLSTSGEQIGLSEEIAREIITHDSFSYPAQIMDVSYGCYPDGMDNKVFMEKSTPGAHNILIYDDLKTGLYINEFLPDNETDITDNSGKYEDWIELYNSNNYPISTAGLFLTDNLTDPGKWRIPFQYPDSTLIPPKGYMIFWADKDEEEGVRHLNFKLSQDGEQIGLYQFVGSELSVIDTLTYTFLESDYSRGRFPDGSSTWYHFLHTTPAGSNYIAASVNTIDSDSDIRLYPNPSDGLFKLEMALENSLVNNSFSISVYNMNGVLIRQRISTLHAGQNMILEDFDLREFSNGIYLIKIQTPTELITKRVMIQ